MKKLIFYLLFLFGCIALLQAQTLEQKIYIDFGPNDGTNGNITTGPDVNGNYWSNVTVGAVMTAPSVELINSENEPTGYLLEINRSFNTNGIHNGGLLNPSADLLGDFAIATATQDFFFLDSSSPAKAMRIVNLDKERAYKFNIFASREGQDGKTRITKYTLYGHNIVTGTNQASGENMGGPGIHINNSEISESDYVFPDENGEIILEVIRQADDFAYINIIRIDEYSGVEREEISLPLIQTMYFDFGPGDGEQGNITSGADINGNHWNNITDYAVNAKYDLINSANVPTNYNLTITSVFRHNGINNGGLLAPNAELLGDFGIATVTQDFFFIDRNAEDKGALKIGNLIPGHAYRFHIFGTRARNENNENERTSIYTLQGETSFQGSLQVSGYNLGRDNGIHQNDHTILKTDLLYPDANGEISLELTYQTGTFAYINAMKVEEYSIKQEEALAQKIYIDFGPNDGTNGNITTGPDVNGNYWSNVTVGAVMTAPSVELINSENEPTGYLLEINRSFNTNGIHNGGLLNPSADLLGDFAIATATQDFFFLDSNSKAKALRIVNLDKDRAYKFNIFASREATKTRITEYTLYGYNIVRGTNQASGENFGGQGIHTNNREISESDYVFPDENGEIILEVIRQADDFAYINIIRIDEYIGVEKPKESIPLIQTMYFDFGLNNGVDGNETLGADVNGNYWNNITDYEANANYALINSKNVATNYNLTITETFRSNGIRNGGLLNPSADLLGDFAIATATQDFFYLDENINPKGELKIRNLIPGRGYRFYIFGTREGDINAEDERTSLYTLTGKNTFKGTLQASGYKLGRTPGLNQNDHTVLKSDLIYPDDNGEITLEVGYQASIFAYLTCLKIEEYGDQSMELPTAITISGEDITESGKAIQMTATPEPYYATIPFIRWSVDNEEIAWIDSDGMLYPKANGIVNVTATTLYGADAISDTKEITISNQITELYVVGTASERGEGLHNGIPFRMVSGPNKEVTNIFETYTSLQEGGEFHLYTNLSEEDANKYGHSDDNTGLIIDGTGIRPENVGTVRITVNLNNHTYKILPISKWSVVGDLISDGWNGDEALDYQGDGVWSKKIDLTKGASTGAIAFRANEDESLWFKRIKGTDDQLMMVSYAQENGYQVENISLKGNEYTVTLDLREYTYTLDCSESSEFTISFMGSSVANGTGASENTGYAHLYASLLQKRATQGLGYNWNVSNISIGGNTTTNLLNRFDSDLLTDCSNYVIYGVSLGNEGIHEKGQSSFDSYRDNMLKLIQQARDNGVYPIACNNYTRGDFNATDYEYVKQLNLLMHEWDIPTINLLGAIDNGEGRWASAHQVPGDPYHPNNSGHFELFYSIVPSMMDAIHEGKSLPERVEEGTSYQLGTDLSDSKIELIPENIAHPFTLSFDIKTKEEGNIASVYRGEVPGYIKVNSGSITYTSPLGNEIVSAISLLDDQWHNVTLTHYYAQGRTLLYVDGEELGEVSEKIIPAKFYLGDEYAPGNISYRQLFFYRAGMNDYEIAALNEGRMLKSSLELYAPLGVAEEDGLVNLAQSTNTLSLVKLDYTGIGSIEQTNPTGPFDVYTIDGIKVMTIQLEEDGSIPQGILNPGFYIINREKVIVR